MSPSLKEVRAERMGPEEAVCYLGSVKPTTNTPKYQLSSKYFFPYRYSKYQTLHHLHNLLPNTTGMGGIDVYLYFFSDIKEYIAIQPPMAKPLWSSLY